MDGCDYEIVEYRPEFREQILQVQRHLWGPDVDVNSAYFKWKYDENPYLDTTLIYVALCKEKVVGMRGFYGAKWEVRDSSQTAFVLCAGDLVVDPEHRRRGLFRRIMAMALHDLATRGYLYVFSLSASVITKVGSLTMGWRPVGSLKPMDWNLRGRVSSADRARPFDELERTARDGKSNVIVGHAPRPEPMAELVERIGYQGKIRHVRDSEYLAWRFRNPLSSYRFLFWGGSRLEGYLVLQTRIYTDKLWVNIVDWEFVDDRVGAELLRAAVDWGGFDKITIWSATLSESAKATLKSNRFDLWNEVEYFASIPTVLVKRVQDQVKNAEWTLNDMRLLDIGSWDLRMAYSDGY
jgi:GNAT superfamily N-acetyltransferase